MRKINRSFQEAKMDYLNKCEDIKALLLSEKVYVLNDKTQMLEV